VEDPLVCLIVAAHRDQEHRVPGLGIGIMLRLELQCPAELTLGTEKPVLRHPLTITPKSAIFPRHRTAHTLMERLTALDERAGWSKVPGVIGAAMRG
jgi:hypothetical protein